MQKSQETQNIKNKISSWIENIKLLIKAIKCSYNTTKEKLKEKMEKEIGNK